VINCKFQHLENLLRCEQRILEPLEFHKYTQGESSFWSSWEIPSLLELFNLKELIIWSSKGQMDFKKLILKNLSVLDSMIVIRSSKNGVWNSQTLPRLCVSKIYDCLSFKRFSIGMGKLPNFNVIWRNRLVGNHNWGM